MARVDEADLADEGLVEDRVDHLAVVGGALGMAAHAGASIEHRDVRYNTKRRPC